MALGTITRVNTDPHGLSLPVAIGDMKITLSTVVGDSAYATGGSALTAANLGLGTLVAAMVVGIQGSAANNGAVQAYFNNSTKKLQCFATSGTSPVALVEAGAVNLSGLTFVILAIGY